MAFRNLLLEILYVLSVHDLCGRPPRAPEGMEYVCCGRGIYFQWIHNWLCFLSHYPFRVGRPDRTQARLPLVKCFHRLRLLGFRPACTRILLRPNSLYSYKSRVGGNLYNRDHVDCGSLPQHNSGESRWILHRKHFPEFHSIVGNQWGRVTVWRLSTLLPSNLPRSISRFDLNMDYPRFNTEFNIAETRRTEVLGRGLAK